MEYIIIFGTGVFAFWMYMYSYNSNKNRIEQNIIEYEEKKAKQQKSKVLAKRKTRRTKNQKESINVYHSNR